MSDEEREELAIIIRKIDEKITTIYTVLLGVPDTQNGGLVDKVNNVCEEHKKLSKNFFILVGVLAGSGLLGGSIAGIIQLLK